MKLFKRRNKGSSSTAPQGGDVIAGQTSNGSRIDWRRAVPRLLILVLAAALLVFAIIKLVDALNGSEPAKPAVKKPVQVARQPERKPTAPQRSSTGQEGAKPDRPASDTPSQRPSASAPSTPQNSKPPATSSQNQPPAKGGQPLADTGPGETIALFLITSTAGTVAYQVRLRRSLA